MQWVAMSACQPALTPSVTATRDSLKRYSGSSRSLYVPQSLLSSLRCRSYGTFLCTQDGRWISGTGEKAPHFSSFGQTCMPYSLASTCRWTAYHGMSLRWQAYMVSNQKPRQRRGVPRYQRGIAFVCWPINRWLLAEFGCDGRLHMIPTIDVLSP